MLDILRIAARVNDVGAEMGGVFALSDLQNLLGSSTKAGFYRRLRRLEDEGIVSRFTRGFYVTPDYDPKILSQRICPESYISFGTVLAENLLIGSIPSHRIVAVKTGPSRVYDNGSFRVEQLEMTRSLFFGYRTVQGVNVALPEKAVLDTLYFYQKGRKFSFDVYSDIDYSGIDKEKVKEFLQEYRNPVFKTFARKLIDG